MSSCLWRFFGDPLKSFESQPRFLLRLIFTMARYAQRRRFHSGKPDSLQFDSNPERRNIRQAAKHRWSIEPARPERTAQSPPAISSGYFSAAPTTGHEANSRQDSRPFNSVLESFLFSRTTLCTFA